MRLYQTALTTNGLAAVYQGDSDGDGIPDLWEIQHGLNPFNPDDANLPSVNPFAHGLGNLQVYQNQSVLIADNYSTLGDGIADWWKVKYGFSLTDTGVAARASTQPFAHGLTNLQVYQNPSVLNADNFSTVSDGIPDWWRVKYFASGSTTNGNSCASCDPDGDGVNNLQEFQRGTDPTNSGSLNVTVYADSTLGNDSYDGYAATVGGGHGPKQDIQAAISTAINNDTVRIAGGAYVGTSFNLQGHNINVQASGPVSIQGE